MRSNFTKAKKKNAVTPGKSFLAVGMMLLLLWLTSINFVIYSGSFKAHQQMALIDTSEEEAPENYPGNPAGPDEKSPNCPISISEEYIHEGEHTVNPFWINSLFQHRVHEAEKLCIVHSDLFSPPPEA